MTNGERASTRIALHVTRDRNRELLASLFTDQEVVEITGDVPRSTDICIVDEAGLARVGDRLGAWRDDQHPTFAPVLLLAESDRQNPWDRYAEALSRQIDAIMQIPASKSAITARIEILLEMRDFSRKLASEHQLTQRIFDTSPLAKVVLDTDGRIVRANQRAADLFGVPKSELTGRTYDEGDWTFLDEAETPIPASELPYSQVLRTGDPVYGYEHALDCPDRERLWLSVSMGPIRDENGDVEYVVGALEDVTLRRAQERELERQVDLFEKAQDIADVGAWEYDVRTDEFYWTEEVYRIHGLPLDADPSPELSLEHYHPEDRSVIEGVFERAIREGESYDVEARLIDADDRQRWVRTRGEPQYVDGELVRLRGTLQDVTDRKERELELRQMTRAVDEAPVGVVVTDPSLEDNPIIYANERFTELTGYSREASVGRNCRFLQGDNTDPETVAQIRRAVDAEEPVSVVLRNYRADGTEFWNSLSIAPVRDEDGEVINFIGFQQDVTERVERRRQIDVLDRYLRHNLRNKMNVVQGLAELIAKEGEPPLTEYAERIDETTVTLLQNMSKEREIANVLQEGPVVEPVDVSSTLRSKVEELRSEYPAAEISLSGPESVPVSGTKRLPVAFAELLENAVEHNDSESPTVDVAVRCDDAEVTVRIADDGPGIPEMEVAALTGGKTETAVFHGQGLGLWLVYLVVRRSGGTVAFDDNDPAGSVVTVTLSPA